MIRFVRGIIISDSELRMLIGRRYVDLWSEWLSVKKLGRSWADFAKTVNFSKYLNLGVYTWPSHSELYHTKYAVGIGFGPEDHEWDIVRCPDRDRDQDANLYIKLLSYDFSLRPMDIETFVMK